MSSKKSHKPARSHRSTLSMQKTEILINVYDLLPPGRISSALWFFGTSLLHSGVVINGREYAYGGHAHRGKTGVYWTAPRTEPPGGTFRCELLHGFTLASPTEIDAIIREVSEEFLGTSYNLLTKNCNHFTSHLCQKLTGLPGPAWLNRAASIGVALPCVVPKDWIEVPEYDTADGELVDEAHLGGSGQQGHGGGGGGRDKREERRAAREERKRAAREEDEEELLADERSRMLRSPGASPTLVDLGRERNRERPTTSYTNIGNGNEGEGDGQYRDDEGEADEGGKGKGKAAVATRDSAGRKLPPAERAPTS
ncbi:PPPDE putative peptidase domain-containing protein [Sordaria brevicollis]|uniref:PPPDE putative peptidase domain-containing protein n=1 Tax=Sordaria brevicollis TaxID=83679 RepID=A0AAE0NW98_SORBR|nr:PPPDE putative peptidase domain-containing protein [Sordaria brevicollis]